MHRRFRIVLPKIHRRFRIGPPKIRRRFRIGPPQVTFNLLLPEFHSRWILVYHGYYARKATKLPIWNRMCNIPLAPRKYWRVWFQYSIVKNDIMWFEVKSDMYIVKPSIKHGAVENVSGGWISTFRGDTEQEIRWSADIYISYTLIPPIFISPIRSCLLYQYLWHTHSSHIYISYIHILTIFISLTHSYIYISQTLVPPTFIYLRHSTLRHLFLLHPSNIISSHISHIYS